MDPFTIAALAQAGIGIGQAVAGTIKKGEAEKAKESARGALATTDYADYNQAYYEELKRRESLGLPEEQRMYAEGMAERAAGVGLAVGEDRRSGLIGVGRAQTGLSDAYANIAMADIAQREQNAQALLGEMSKRGAQTYSEDMSLAQLDLSLAEQARQEALGLQQSGIQGAMDSAGTMATYFGGGRPLADIYGTGGTTSTATPQAPTNYTPPTLSLSQNNSPFAYGNGLNYTQGLYDSRIESINNVGGTPGLKLLPDIVRLDAAGNPIRSSEIRPTNF